MELVRLLFVAYLVVQSGAVWAGNLIANPDAEAGVGSLGGSVVNVPGWLTVGDFTAVQYGASGGTPATSGFPTQDGPGPADRGMNFFAGGPNNSSSSASQIVDLSTYEVEIDHGGVSFTLSGYLGGFSVQDDDASLSATFMSVSGTSLGETSLGPVTAGDRNNVTGLLFSSTVGFVPIGARTVLINLQMTRTDGAYDDGYADDLSLTLQSVPEPSGLVLVSSGIVGLIGYRIRRVLKSHLGS